MRHILISITLFLATVPALLPCSFGPDPLYLFSPVEIVGVLGSRSLPSSLIPAAVDESCRKAPVLPDRNLGAWQKSLKERTGSELKTAAVGELVYKLPLAMLQAAAKSKPAEAGRYKNEALRALVKAGAADDLRYLAYTRRVEPLVHFTVDSWEPEAKKWDLSQVNLLVNEALAGGKQTRARDLKIRHYYQAMRLLHYSGQPQRALNVQREHLADLKSGDPLFDRIKSLEAGALARTGQETRAILLFAELFKDPAFQVGNALRDFGIYYSRGETFARALKEAPGPDLRVQLLFMRGLADPAPALPLMEQIVATGAVDDRLDYLFLEEVRRLEERLEDPLFYPAAGAEEKPVGWFAAVMRLVERWFVGALYAEAPARIPEEERDYMRKLAAFAERTAEREGVSLKDIWLVTRAYLLFLLGEERAVRRVLETPALASSANVFVQKQKAQIELLNLTMNSDEVDETLQKKVIEIYPVMLSGRDTEQARACGYADRGATLYLRRQLMRLHRQADEHALALLVDPRLLDPDEEAPLQNAPPAVIEEAARILKDPGGSYQNFLRTMSEAPWMDLVDRAGSRYLAEGQYTQAVRVFTGLPAARLDALNREYTKKKDPFENPFFRPAGTGYRPNWNKLEIAREYVDLEARAAKPADPRAAWQAQYRLGLGRFNMSHAGDWWIAMRPYWSSFYRYSEKPGDPDLKVARTHFEKALALGPDPENAAAIRYMIAWIDYIDQTKNVDMEDTNTIRLTPEQKKQFATFEQYANTEFYKKVIRECTYYQKYRK